MYTVELCIKFCKVILVHYMEEIGKSNGFKVTHHGWDRLVFTSDSGVNFTKMINELSNLCETYGTNYVDLLNLD